NRPEWKGELAEAGKRCMEQMQALRATLQPEALSEAQLEKRWIQPVLELLGHHYFIQPKIRYREKGYRTPDYMFFASEDEANRMTDAIYNPADLTHVLAVGDAKSWGTRLDQSSKTEQGGQRNPSEQIDEYLRFSERPWGILTDGRYWRLYHRD